MLANKMDLFNGMLSINIPENFTIMKKEDVDKFFRGDKPTLAYSDEENRALISLLLTENAIEQENVENRIQEYAKLYQRVVPNFANCKIATRTLDHW